MKVAQLLVGQAVISEASLLSKSKLPGLGQETLISIPYRSYKNDCWKKRPVSSSFLQNPGAGMDLDAIEPFVTVEKDGFMMTGCIKDAMYEQGDKHGNNKMNYKMGGTANVSIVHYTQFVPKEDRKLTTHATCFEFCRTVPNMVFFGINNGRDCYCTPFFNAMGADMDGANCDSVCEGDTSLMCGGKRKSSIFEMHSCDHTEAQLETAREDLGEAMEALQSSVDELKQATEKGEADATTVQEIFGAAGDPDASNLCQEARVYAGELLHLGEDAQELLDAGEEKRMEAGSLAGKNFKQLENAKAAEKAIKEMNDAITAITEKGEKVQAALTDAHPEESEDDASDLEQYVSIMTFADNHARGGIHTDAPSTCTGEILQISYDQSLGGCAARCDDMLPQGCKAYQFIGEGGLCFLFKSVKKAQYYTGCGDGEEFLQTAKKTTKGNEPFAANCMVKLSDYANTGDLKNELFSNTAHVNSFGLKELTKADRCY